MNTCTRCNYYYDTPDCPCTWINAYKSLPGYEYASIGDISPELSRRIIEDIDGGIYPLMFGCSGSGKTHTAVSVSKYLSEERSIQWDLMSRLSTDPTEYNKQYQFYVQIPILIVDELSNAHYDLCKERIDEGRITIGTTNSISFVDGEIQSALDSRFTTWRFDTICLSDILSRDWIIKRRKDKKAIYEAWEQWNSVNNDSFEVINFEEDIKEDEVC